MSRVLSRALYSETTLRSSFSMPCWLSSDSCVKAVRSWSGMWIVDCAGRYTVDQRR